MSSVTFFTCGIFYVKIILDGYELQIFFFFKLDVLHFGMKVFIWYCILPSLLGDFFHFLNCKIDPKSCKILLCCSWRQL